LKTIILAAGKIDYTQLPFGMHQSNATVPVNGKPVISWILDDLIRKKHTNITVVIRRENHRLQQLLTNHYAPKTQLTIVELDHPISINHSLKAGLETTDTPNNVELILGDTLIYDSYDETSDCLFIQQVNNPENWCVAHTNEKQQLIGFSDKCKLDGKQLALCGYYGFSDIALLQQATEDSIIKDAKELSHTLFYYHQHKPLKLKQVTTWFDFGHLGSMIQSKKSLLRPRHFNALTIDPILNTITKISEKSDKLADELAWYKSLPEELKVLTPRILETNEENAQVIIKQEYYGYPALAELFVYGDLHPNIWESIMDYLFQIHEQFKKHTYAIKQEVLLGMYQHKTNERIEQLFKQNDYWKVLFNQPTVTINNTLYKNIPELLNNLKLPLGQLCESNLGSVIHGDYCLSNILYDLNNQIVRLIDPRGSFGEKGIYGDPRYDMAKLRHSLVGLYDYIVGDLFHINEHEGVFTYCLFHDEKNPILAQVFDDLLLKYNYNINEIQLIEGLLFLSMIPYHTDYPDRQKMMYIRSIEILSRLEKVTT
jgi:dTDP-glucose pyrophosphorylase